jgi:hypothetical protein
MLRAYYDSFFKTRQQDAISPLNRYHDQCKLIEQDVNYRTEFSNIELYNLVFKNGKDRHSPSKQATVITETPFKSDQGKFYQIKYTGWYSMGETWYPDVQDKYLIHVSKSNGGVMVYETSDIEKLEHPRKDLPLHQFLNQECLLPALRDKTLTM